MPQLLPKVLLKLFSVQTGFICSKIWERPWRGFWRVIWLPLANVRPKLRQMRRHQFGNPNEQLVLPPNWSTFNKTDERSAWHDINR